MIVCSSKSLVPCSIFISLHPFNIQDSLLDIHFSSSLQHSKSLVPCSIFISLLPFNIQDSLFLARYSNPCSIFNLFSISISSNLLKNLVNKKFILKFFLGVHFINPSFKAGAIEKHKLRALAQGFTPKLYIRWQWLPQPLPRLCHRPALPMRP